MAEKLERLLTLTLALLETPRLLGSDEIRARVPGYPDREDSFRRAFERDKEDLRELGVPLVMEEIPFSDPPRLGYRIRPEDYYLRAPDLDPDELAALHLASVAVRIDTAQGLEALWKLGGVVDGAAPVEELAALPDDPNLGPVFGAVVDHQAIRFRYRDAERTLEPYRVEFQRGRWYLTGHEREAGERRTYRLDRIDGTVDLVGPTGAFPRPEGEVAGVELAAWRHGDGPAESVRLLVDAPQAAWVTEHLGEDAVVERRPDGAVVAEVEVRSWPAFRSFVLTFLDHAELLGPEHRRADLVAWLEAIAGEEAS